MAQTITVSTFTSERKKNLRFLRSFFLQFGQGRLFIIPFDTRENKLFNQELNLEI